MSFISHAAFYVPWGLAPAKAAHVVSSETDAQNSQLVVDRFIAHKTSNQVITTAQRNGGKCRRVHELRNHIYSDAKQNLKWTQVELDKYKDCIDLLQSNSYQVFQLDDNQLYIGWYLRQ